MGSHNQVKLMFHEKYLYNLATEGKRDPSFVLSPANFVSVVIGVGPYQVTQNALFRDLLWSFYSLYLFQVKQIWG